MRGWLLVALLALSACTVTPPPEQPEDAAPTAPGSARPLPTPEDQQRLVSVMLTDDDGALLDLDRASGAVPFAEPDDKGYALVEKCADTLTSDANIVAAERAQWQNEDYAVTELAVRYEVIEASAAVWEVRMTSGCRGDVGPGRIVTVQVPPFSDIDAGVAFCTIGEDDLSQCVVVEAVGDLAVAAEVKQLGNTNRARLGSAQVFVQRLAIELGQRLERAT
ncbi:MULTISPECIES: hypothetical protein [Amycolatopsis]|uniref:Lipoprotein n=1 Tax=Amycolatopsis thermalba TaxID=944492 RepID=A0ABY4P455_9PSEU|nr:MULTISPECIES: hypothetical protein [Amycolatopsis]OXM63188.1 hypothetical protein CF166_32025 [Amycolatopsis sp. KNN50.9b]UQS26998.1 hypothetical protein L1857_31470 [Amycolatopsis thermalba]